MNKQRGDTIVEVLLAIVVAAAVLAGAYVSTNQSTNTTIRSREHDEGVKLAQSQIEQLKPALLTSIGTARPLTNEAGFFCMNSGAPGIPRYFAAGLYTPPLPAIETTQGSGYQPECRLDNNTNQYGAGSIGTRYLVSIQNTTPNGANDDLYKVNVRWPKAGGGWDQVEFVYRLYP